MTGKKHFISILNRLRSDDWFIPVSKKLPGKWILYEFYTEPGDELIRMDTAAMKEEGLYWSFGLSTDQQYIHQTNLTIPLVSDMTNGTWSRTRNFISIFHPEGFSKNVKFQFALDKGTLKLLKKNHAGKIEFFGFFQQQRKD